METFLSVVGVLVLVAWAVLWIAMSAALVACEPRRERTAGLGFFGKRAGAERRPTPQRGGR